MLDGKTLRWGICATGKICRDFASCLLALPNDEHQLRAVGASTKERAKQFADEFGVPCAHGSYQELANDVEVDVVYVGSVNSKHYEHAKMMLHGGKAVLCEKPCCLTPKEVEELINLATEKNLFFMEGIWSRCFPVYAMVERAIADGEIGEPQMVQVTFGRYISEDPSHRVVRMELGGGSMYDLGVYLLQFSQFVFKEKPTNVQGTGFINDEGVDSMVGMTLKYSKRRLATMACSVVCNLPCEAIICGTKGMITVASPFWCPTRITINGVAREFPLPQIRRPVIYDNSEGLTYEAREVRKCLLSKLTESPIVPHKDSIELAEITEEILKQIGYGTPP